MSTRRFAIGTAAATAIIAPLMVASSTVAGADNRSVIGTGPDYVYGTNALTGATATVSAAELGNESSQLALDVAGVNAPAGTRFGAHVHNLPCGAAPSSSGGHYVEQGARGSLEHREMWLDFAVDALGRGHAVATRNWSVDNRPNRSVVIHVLATDHETGAAGTRLACIDLDD